MGQVQHGIADQYHQLSVLAKEPAGERTVVGLDDYAFSCPLPELLLRSPELLAVAANNQRRFSLLLFLLFVWHFPFWIGHTFPSGVLFTDTHRLEDTQRPRRETSLARQLQFFKETHGLQSVILPRNGNHRLKSAPLPSRNRRETSSARRLTPNFTKIFRK